MNDDNRYAFTVSEIFHDGRVLIFVYERIGKDVQAVMLVSTDRACQEWQTLLTVNLHTKGKQQ